MPAERSSPTLPTTTRSSKGASLSRPAPATGLAVIWAHCGSKAAELKIQHFRVTSARISDSTLLKQANRDGNNQHKYSYEPTAADREKIKNQEQSPNPRSETQGGCQRWRWPYRDHLVQLHKAARAVLKSPDRSQPPSRKPPLPKLRRASGYGEPGRSEIR
jgi:hypothetical protein